MASRASDSGKKGKKYSVQQANDSLGDLFSAVSRIKKEIQDSRSASIKEKLRKNVELVSATTSNLLSNLRKDVWMMDLNTNGSEDRLLSRVAKDINESANKDTEMTPTITVKLPCVEKISPYTTWIFLDKNQRMADDQSVVGRRQIYYDQYGGETLISSDSEDEVAEPEVKRIFYEGEDQMLWKVLQEYGQTQEVLDSLSQFIEAKPSEIQDRFNALKEKDQEKRAKAVEVSAENPLERSTFLDKSLSAALDSFDNLFCRRCLVFDCRLHGCSQSLFTPSEKQSSWCGLEENKDPCSDQCYLRARRDDANVCKRSDTHTSCTTEALMVKDQALLSSRNDERSSGNLGRDVTPNEKCRDGRKIADISPGGGTVHKVSAGASNEILGKRKVLKHVNITANKSTLGSYDKQGCSNKKQKKISGPDVAYVSADGRPDSDPIPEADIRLSESQVVGQSLNCQEAQVEEALNNNLEWNSIEKELYLKGIEIFGKNSCLIARNLLSGLKTCVEVHTYMEDDGNAMLQTSSSLMDLCTKDKGKTENDHKDQEMPTRSRFLRKKGRARKLKYTWKSAVHPSTHKRIAGGKNQMLKHYTPCDCQLMCGKDCSCLRNGTCCEKYCGCSKSCKYRFRGCHCAKSQCRSRQCPCFAANRECDPDVCKNCWVSCGDGSLGEPPARGDGYKCGNMKLLLKQRQRILLAKSNVAGWGAFLKNPVNKNDYLGEYTGELISHKEADKRGKIYDRLHSSYLFDLNDQCVLDAYRKGDKLKFANHSSKPNCHAKVSLVAGDHRVGIYASEHIDAGEEIFYDYGYPPDTHYEWARKPEGSKRDDFSTPNTHARKHQPC